MSVLYLWYDMREYYAATAEVLDTDAIPIHKKQIDTIPINKKMNRYDTDKRKNESIYVYEFDT